METKKPDFVYVTYIATTPEKLWQALMDTDLMAQWWVDPKAGCARVNVSTWKPGAPWEHRRADGSGVVDIAGLVVEADAPRRLVYTWARPGEVSEEAKHSRVSFDIVPYTDTLVKLTVIHDDLAKDPRMLAGVSGGWPTVLSNLKTFLETGHALPHTAAVHA
ncbi:MAG: SRPBCC family protein [Rhodoferax sp.]|nr:SRPBCC family protein [Rhodoferax sp.]